MSDVKDVKETMRELMDELKRASDAYYLSPQPIMTDYEYDTKRKRLTELSEQNPHVAEVLSVQKFLDIVGTTVVSNGYEPLRHDPPMLSLDNAYTEEDVTAWFTKARDAGAQSFVITPKYDGLAWECIYEDGLLTQAGTRGDGYVGENLMATANHIMTIPPSIPVKERVCVRGEIVLSWDHFEQAKELDGQDYANPRNAAAGIARRKTPKESTELLVFIAYGLEGSIKTDSYEKDLKLLRKLGFYTTNYAIATDVKQVMKKIEKIERDRPTAQFMYDGAVIRVNENDVFEGMGYTSHHPRAATAFKFTAERAETVLKDVEWTRGKKGKLSPNARLETVQLAGTRVSNALLHTMKKIQELDVRIGDVVIVEKAAEIIPQVVGVRHDLRTGREKEIVAPTHCPICNSPTHMRGEYVYCGNNNCGDVAKNRLLTYVASIGLKGIGPSTAQGLADNGRFQHVPDLYELTEQDFIDAGVAPKNATKLVQAIRKSIGRNKPREILAGLSIDMCGIGTATDLIEGGKRTIKDMCYKDEQWFAEIRNIGAKTAQSLANWFNNPDNVAVVRRLYEIGVIVDHQTTENVRDGAASTESKPLANLKVCITGTLTYPRSHYAKLIEENGGTFTNNLSKSTDVLVVGQNAGSKLKKAQEANIEIWTEEEFFAKLQ